MPPAVDPADAAATHMRHQLVSTPTPVLLLLGLSSWDGLFVTSTPAAVTTAAAAGGAAVAAAAAAVERH